MFKSMTGYGRGEAYAGGRKFTVELKSVNHRYCEVVMRLPRVMSALEDRARRLVQTRVSRGRVDGYFSTESSGGNSAAVKVDKALATSYYKAMKELKEALQLDGEVKLKHLLAMPDVLTAAEVEEDVEEWWPAVSEALEAALDQLVRMRATEGEKLVADIMKRVEIVAALNEIIRARSPVVVEEYRERLSTRLKDLIAEGSLDEGRLVAEAALYAERSNITEETVRLESHLAQVRACLQSNESVGRKLDFLLQEMNREINTIASKSGDLEISRAVVEVKSELEKVREQVQNIE